ncbi:MAG: DoxX family protein [Actinobacteria bacterium]|nr:DoxX family protein [Actinomycetota bacterium]
MAEPTEVQTEARFRAREWPKSAVRIAFGVIWLVDAVLKWLPGFRADYMDLLREGADGQPGWLKPWFDFWIRLQRPYSGFFAYLVAGVETVIALAVILGFARKLTYISATAFSLLIWSTAEGFGGPYTTGAADVGTAIIYAVVFLALLVLNAQLGPSRYSVDFLIERRIPWWYRVAEVGGVPRPETARVPGTSSRAAPTSSGGEGAHA